MNRYYYYIIFINSLTNVIIFLPKVLIGDRYQGALTAILVSVPYSSVLFYSFTRAIKSFPNQSLPEIIRLFPYWLQLVIMFLFCSPWYISGTMMLSAISEISQLFINPDISLFMLLSLYIAVILFVIRYKGTTILYGLELFFVLIASIMAFIFIRAVSDSNFNWDSVAEVGTHTAVLPSLFSIGVSTYSFTGYTDMLAFNKDFRGAFRPKRLWMVPIVNLIILLFTFIIPIGFLGTEGAGYYEYPFIAASDSISLQMGIIDRVLFYYLFVYVLTGLINVIVHWKVSLELVKGTMTEQFHCRNAAKYTWLILILFASIPFAIRWVMKDMEVFSLYWLSLRLIAETILVIIIVYAVRMKQRGVKPH